MTNEETAALIGGGCLAVHAAVSAMPHLYPVSHPMREAANGSGWPVRHAHLVREQRLHAAPEALVRSSSCIGHITYISRTQTHTRTRTHHTGHIMLLLFRMHDRRK
eukprot:COSAG01_NODE_422_length_17262_cov_42.635903_5_plen_106_part_00